MSKKRFLQLLEEKLQILSEEERNDILNEYKDTIEEKVKHGSSEEEAVADFGSIEELSREILKAYKINPDYTKGKDKVKEIVEDGEDLIKKGAKKLSEWTQDVVEDFKNSDRNWTLETIFEVIIKVILLLIGLSFLRIPFYFIEHLATNLFEMTLPPFHSFFEIVLKCLIGFVYLVVCVIIGMIVLKPYFETSGKKPKKKETNSQKEEKNSQVNASKGGNVIVSILKCLLFICVIIPLCLIDFGCFLGLGVVILLLIEGVPLLGPTLLLLSLSTFFTFFIRFLYRMIYEKKKIYCYPLIISAILFASGCFFSLSTAMDFEVYDGLPQHSFSKTETVYQETISNEFFKISFQDYRIEEDKSLEDGQIQIVVSYYKDFVADIITSKKELNDTTIFSFQTHPVIKKSTRKKLYQIVVKELKDLHWYHYREFGDLEIIIRANQNTIAKIK